MTFDINKPFTRRDGLPILGFNAFPPNGIWYVFSNNGTPEIRLVGLDGCGRGAHEADLVNVRDVLFRRWHQQCQDERLPYSVVTFDYDRGVRPCVRTTWFSDGSVEAEVLT